MSVHCQVVPLKIPDFFGFVAVSVVPVGGGSFAGNFHPSSVENHAFLPPKLIFFLPNDLFFTPNPVILAGTRMFPTQKLIFFSSNTVFFTKIQAVSLDFQTTKSKIRAVGKKSVSFAGNFRSSRRQNRLNMTYCHMAK
jgi:hypothetical protein